MHSSGLSLPDDGFSVGLGRRCPPARSDALVSAMMPEGSGDRRAQNRTESLLGAGGIVSVGLLADEIAVRRYQPA